MNESKAIETLANIFHFETYTGENGNYELSSNYWNLKFNVRIREFGITIVNDLSTRCSLDTDEDETTIARELLHFIGDVICDASKTYTYEGDSGILAWPYSCNFAYIKTLKQNMDMNPDELEYQYAGRKAGLTNSKKPVKSGLDNERYQEFKMDMFHAIADVYQKYNMNADGPMADKNDFEKAIQWMEDHDFWEEDTEDYEIESSMQGQERGIQAIMDEYGCTREEALEIMNQDITSGCHSDSKKKKAKKGEKKSIKSSVDETELLERGYNGYQVTKDDSGAWCVPELDLRFWAPDELMSYIDDNYSNDDWDDEDWDDEIESSVDRNHKNIQALYN